MALSSSPLIRDDAPISLLVNEDTDMHDAFRIIDQEVNKYQTYIKALWKRRNTFAPISRLPPEVFCKIFDFTRQDETTGLLRWIKVSHVCHEWRNIAVNSPSLWTKLPITNARWTEEMLSRSKMASLTVDVNFSPLYRTFSVETVSLVLRHTSRIRHLNLSIIDAEVMQNLLSALPKSAPRLESLGIHVIRKYSSATSNENCELPENVLSKMDCLRRLEVTRCKINWDSHLWNSLTCLKVHDTPLPSRPTTTQVWNALRRMPLLESLDLHDTLTVTADSQQPRETIFLAHLQELTISSSTPSVQQFLKGISFLPTVIIKIVCKSTTPGSDFAGALSVISSFLSPSTKFRGVNIRTLEILESSGYLDGIQFRTYTNVVSDFEVAIGNTVPNLDLTLGCPTETKVEADKILKDVCGAIPLENIVNLHLCPNVSFTSRTLAKTFGKLAHLRSVYTTGVCANEFTLALQKIRPNQNLKKSRTPSVYFRSLRSISMRDVNFDDYEDLTIDALQDCLIWRYECGVEILDLKIEDCFGITENNVSLLEDIIVNLDWDGVEMEISDEEDEDEDDFEDDSDGYVGYDDDFDYYSW